MGESHWESFVTAFSGLLAVLLLAGSVALARASGRSSALPVLKMMSAGGLAATALFGMALIYQLITQFLAVLAIMK